MTKEALIEQLRAKRNEAAATGDHGEALVLNDRIHDLKAADDLSPMVERVMRQFDSALTRKRFYGEPSAH